MTIAKAIVAAVGVVVTALTAALADDMLGLDEIGVLVTALIEAVVSVYAVWRIPNATPEPE